MAAFVGWGSAWGSAFGEGSASTPGAMAGHATLAITASLQYQAPEATTTGSNKRRPQIQWLPAHVPYVAPHLATPPRRRPRKARDHDLMFLGR